MAIGARSGVPVGVRSRVSFLGKGAVIKASGTSTRIAVGRALTLIEIMLGGGGCANGNGMRSIV